MKKEKRAAPCRQDSGAHPHLRRRTFDRASHAEAHLCAAHGCGGRQGLASASTVQKDVGARGLKNTGNVEAARAVGKRDRREAKAAGVTRVAFDRAGFQYHGRVKALAEAAREAGLEF